MAILSFRRDKGGSHRFRRVIAPFLFFFSFFSYSASVELKINNLGDLREYLPQQCLVDNGVALMRCLRDTFDRTFFENGDLYELRYTKNEGLKFCPDIECNWFRYEDQWAVAAEQRYDYTVRNMNTNETSSHSVIIAGFLKNNGCHIRYNFVRCLDTCQTSEECKARVQAVCGAGTTVGDWRYVHNNDYHGNCVPDDPDHDPDSQPPHRFDPLMGPRGYTGNDGKDGADGKDGRDCNVSDNASGGVIIHCGTGVSATSQLLYDGEKGDKGDKGDRGDKGDNGLNGVNGLDGDSCTTSQTSDIQVTITCGQTQTVLNSIEPQNPDNGGGGSGTDDGNLDPEILAQLTQANSKTDAVLGNLGSIQGQLGGINGAVSSVSSQMSGMLSNQGRLIGEASGTNGRLDALLGINGGIQGQLGALNGGIGQANSHLSNLSNSVSAIEGMLSNNSDAEDASEFFGNENGHPAIRDQIGGEDHMETTTTDVGSLIGSSKYLNGSGISFGSSNQCPAPQQISVLGNNIEFSWEPLCDIASVLHTIVILVSWFLVYKLFIRSI